MTSRALRRANDRRTAKEARSARRRAIALGACATTLGAGAALGGAVVTASPAMAADYVVTNTDDSGAGSLRDALDAANNLGSDDDAITFAPGVTGTITLTSGQLEIDTSVTLTGPGADKLTIDAGHDSRVLDVDGVNERAYDISVSGLTLTGGEPTEGDPGGGINANGGALTLSDVVITDSGAIDGGGVATYNTDLTMSDVRLTGNQALTGGGLFALRSTVQMTGSTLAGNGANYGGGVSLTNLNPDGAVIQDSQITGNSVNSGGGGLYAYVDSLQGGSFPVTVSDSTISDNYAGGTGGAILTAYYYSPVGVNVTLVGTTVADNESPDVGGIAASAGTNRIEDSIVADNGTDLGVVSGYATPFQLDYSLIQDPGDAPTNAVTPGSVITGLDPQLADLADNGGPTQTMLPAATSPAIDTGRAFDLITDQRGLPRTVDLPNVPNATGSDATDMGAAERQLPVATPPTSTATPTCDGLPATIVAVPGVPTTGTPGPDVIVGTTGDDTITGADGNDLICGGTGNDTVRGGPGNDTLSGDTGDDTLKGNTGNDKLTGGDGNDKLSAGKGKDTLLGGPGNDTLKGKSGNDKLSGQAGKDKLRGGSGNDKGHGGPGRDHTHGGSGHDHLHPRTTA